MKRLGWVGVRAKHLSVEQLEVVKGKIIAIVSLRSCRLGVVPLSEHEYVHACVGFV